MARIVRNKEPRGNARNAALRAARAYADPESVEAWANNLGLSRASVHRFETKDDPPEDVLRRAAELSGLPLPFLLGDPAALAPRREPTREEAMRAVADAQAAVDALRARLSEDA